MIRTIGDMVKRTMELEGLSNYHHRDIITTSQGENMNAPGKSLDELVADRSELKRQEEDLATKRKAIDAQIVDALRDPAKQEGAITRALADGRKLTVTYGLTRSVDVEALQKGWAGLPKEAQEALKWKAETNAAFKKLDGAAKVAASAFVTVKPASASIEIKG